MTTNRLIKCSILQNVSIIENKYCDWQKCWQYQTRQHFFTIQVIKNRDSVENHPLKWTYEQNISRIHRIHFHPEKNFFVYYWILLMILLSVAKVLSSKWLFPFLSGNFPLTSFRNCLLLKHKIGEFQQTIINF